LNVIINDKSTDLPKLKMKAEYMPAIHRSKRSSRTDPDRRACGSPALHPADFSPKRSQPCNTAFAQAPYPCLPFLRRILFSSYSPTKILIRRKFAPGRSSKTRFYCFFFPRILKYSIRYIR